MSLNQHRALAKRELHVAWERVLQALVVGQLFPRNGEARPREHVGINSVSYRLGDCVGGSSIKGAGHASLEYLFGVVESLGGTELYGCVQRIFFLGTRLAEGDMGMPIDEAWHDGSPFKSDHLIGGPLILNRE